MSEKQRFNKDIPTRQMAEKRRERWMSRKILTEILENIRLQRDAANWVLYREFQRTAEENYKLCKQLNEANELLQQVYTHLMEKGACTAWNNKKDCEEFSKVLNKIRKRFNNENNK